MQRLMTSWIDVSENYSPLNDFIKVKHKGKVYNGQLAGFKLDFPEVSVADLDIHFEVSKELAVKAINNPLVEINY